MSDAFDHKDTSACLSESYLSSQPGNGFSSPHDSPSPTPDSHGEVNDNDNDDMTSATYHRESDLSDAVFDTDLDLELDEFNDDSFLLAREEGRIPGHDHV